MHKLFERLIYTNNSLTALRISRLGRSRLTPTGTDSTTGKTLSQTDRKEFVKYHGIKAFKNSHPSIKKIKKEYPTSIHGNKVWRSCFVLMDFIRRYHETEVKQAMDIGCGWGVLTAFLAKEFDCHAIGVDADSDVEPYFAFHSHQNAVETSFKQALFENIKGKELKEIDLLTGSDICFWDQMVPPLKKLINRSVKNNVSAIYIADPGRPPFLELVDYCKEKYNAELYRHDIKKPWRSEKFILEILPE